MTAQLIPYCDGPEDGYTFVLDLSWENLGRPSIWFLCRILKGKIGPNHFWCWTGSWWFLSQCSFVQYYALEIRPGHVIGTASDLFQTKCIVLVYVSGHQQWPLNIYLGYGKRWSHIPCTHYWWLSRGFTDTRDLQVKRLSRFLPFVSPETGSNASTWL